MLRRLMMAGGGSVPEDSLWPYVVSVQNYVSDLSDGKGLAWTAVGNAHVTGGELVLDGSGDYISTPNKNSLNFGKQNFTIELVVEFASTSGPNGLYSKYNADAGINIRYDSSVGGFRCVLEGAGGFDAFNISWSPSIGVEYFIEFVRSGNSFYAFVNGTQVGSTQTLVNSVLVNDLTDALVLGTSQTVSSSSLDGVVKASRVTKGVARNTGAHTVPTLPFPEAGPTNPVVTFNPSDKGSNLTISTDNLTVTKSAGDAYSSIRGTLSLDGATGKGYCEFKVVVGTTSPFIIVGIGNASANLNSSVGVDLNSWGYYQETGKSVHNTPGGVAYGASYTTGDVIGMSLDEGALTFFKNGVSQGVAFTGITGDVFPMISVYRGNAPKHVVNGRFSVVDYTYAPPAGIPAWGSSESL